MVEPAPVASAEPTPAAPKAKRRRPRWQRWGIEALIVVGIFSLAQVWHRRNLVPSDGRPVPTVALHDLDGNAVTLANWHGKRVQLHFWTTWCSVCKMEYGALNAVQADLPDDAALVTIVADGEDPARIKAYIAEHGLTYPVLLGNPEAIAAFGVSSFPTNFFVSPEGTLSSSDVGWSTRWGMRWRLGCAE